MFKLALVSAMSLAMVACSSQPAAQVKRDNQLSQSGAQNPAGPREEGAPGVAPSERALRFTTPFPLPRTLAMSDALRSDTGAVAWTAPDRSSVDILTQSGIVSFRLSAATRILDYDGQAVGTDWLSQGRQVRVYYVLQDGAQVLELDGE